MSDTSRSSTDNAFRLEVKELPEGIALITLWGELTLSEVPRLKKVISELIKKGYTRLIFMLEGTSYIDSTGLGTLVSIHRQLNEIQGKMVLTKPSDGIKRALKLTRLNQIFSVCETEEEAMKQINQPTSS